MTFSVAYIDRGEVEVVANGSHTCDVTVVRYELIRRTLTVPEVNKALDAILDFFNSSFVELTEIS